MENSKQRGSVYNTNSTYKALYRQILEWTREKKTRWYKSIDNKNLVRYTLQGTDGYCIHLVHYRNESYDLEYAFLNFRGNYTHREYLELEKAILAAGFKKPLSPLEHRAIKEKEIQSELAQRKKEEAAWQKKEKEEEIERRRKKKKELKERRKLEAQRKAEEQQKIIKRTRNVKCNWELYDLSANKRAYRGIYDKAKIELHVSIKGKANNERYTIVYKSVTGLIPPNDGEAYEKFISGVCKLSEEAKIVMSAKGNTAEAYKALVWASGTEKGEKLFVFQRALHDELVEMLLATYVYSGVEVYGMELLSLDRTGEQLAKISGKEVLFGVGRFRNDLSKFVDSLCKADINRPRREDLYRELIEAYAKNFTVKETHLEQNQVKQFIDKFRNLKKDGGKSIVLQNMREQGQTLNEKQSLVSRKKETQIKNPPKKVNTRDFVIRSSVLSCMYSNHQILNVDAVIKSVNSKGEIAPTIIPAGYCQKCQKFFILDDDYEKLLLAGKPLCTIVEERNYKENYRNNRYFDDLSAWPEESVLSKCGYNVNQARGLTTLERRKILANIIDQEVLSKIEIRSHLKKQMALHKRHLQAVDKWASDEDFVAAYNKGYYARYGIEKLRRI